MVFIQCFGQGAAAAHLVNLGFHVVNTVLLFLVLKRMTGAFWRPALVAALFGWHPLHVESVAWVAERKDVLSGFFFMLTLWAYTHFAQKMEPGGEQTRGTNKSKFQPSSCRNTTTHKPETKIPTRQSSRVSHHAAGFYVLALLFFVLGLMSKPILITLPAVLLLVDFWPLGRFPMRFQNSRLKTILGLLREKIPFFAISVFFCLITFLTQQHAGAIQSLNDCPARVRVDNVLVAYLQYLAKTFWPVGLATPYPDPRLWPAYLCASALALLATMTFGTLWLMKRFPFLVTGWFWFCGILLPVIGIIQVGAQAMADRYTYLPLIGIFILVAWGTHAAFNRWRLPVALRVIMAGLALLACAVRTRDQLHHWQNTESLLGHAVAVTPNNWIAHYNLDRALEGRGRTDEALMHFEQTFAIKPNDVDTLNELGCLLSKKEDTRKHCPILNLR
jgi:tetratricopeptide (TPR) repeat protein